MRSAVSAASQLHEGEGQLVLMMLLHLHFNRKHDDDVKI